MQSRIDSLYDEIAENVSALEEIQVKIQGIKEKQISRERIYDFLEMFDMFYDKFTDMEKKEFFQSFISKIEIYPETLKNGHIIKSIEFNFPVYYKGSEVDMFIPKFGRNAESVVLMSRKNK